MAVDLQTLNNLDLNDVGNWPVAGKAIVIVLLCAALLFAGYWFDTQHQLAQRDAVRAEEAKLKQEFESKQLRAASLEAYKQQMKEMEESFGSMLRQLPSRTEVADLLVDVTQTGLASGLNFDLFKPEHENLKDFYAELPISLRVTGGYHEFGAFASGVAALPRIVTLHDISIAPGTTPGSKLVLSAQAKTYRYLDEQEIAAKQKAEQQQRRKKR